MPVSILIIAGAIVLIQIVAFIMLIMVLTKQIKHGGVFNKIIGIIEIVGPILMISVPFLQPKGALLAIIGIIAFIAGLGCFWTFIWGWIKHKQLGMTKIMLTWSILTLTGMIMVPVMGVSSALMIPQYLQEMSGSGDVKFTNLKSSQKTRQPKLARKNKTLKSEQKLSGQNVDWSQKALALWEGDQYKDPSQAVDYWNRAILNQQNTAIAYSNRGLAYHELGQYQKAVKDYNAAIKRDPGYAAAYSNRGNSYYELTEYQLALNDFNQSLKLDPQNATAHLNRGLVFYQMDKTPQACQDFQRACDQGDCDGIKWAMKNGICN